MRGAVGICLAGLVSFAAPVWGQSDQTALEEIIVTATRRDEVLTRAPINITAVTAAAMADRRMDRIAGLSRWVPGLMVVDQGPRQSNAATVRGLNVTASGSPDELNNDNGGTVATYIGEIPLFLDLKLKDIERVEVLLGPQGTLYGAGTLGGAIRYIPARPDASQFDAAVHASGYGLAHSSSAGFDGDVMVNVPLVEDELAMRAVVSYRDDPGFVDTPYLVQTPGMSLSNPDLTDASLVAANLKEDKDVNTEETVSARLMARWTPTPTLDATLTYMFQHQDGGGRQITNRTALPVFGGDASGAFDYISGARLPERSVRKTHLAALELTADLGFAELTSATGVSWFDQTASRDITDFLINFEDGFEFFPSFVGFTRELADEERINQELRLVSADTGPISWIAGAFYNRYTLDVDDREFTPGAADFIGIDRPDDLEYIQIDAVRRKERALYGEVTYAATDHWRITGGLRWFDYDINQTSGFDLPIFNGDPTAIFLDEASSTVSDNGFTFKLNTAFDLGDTAILYVTVSEGFRTGGANAVPPCPPGPLSPGQTLCALPDERQFKPDRTLNKEIGLKGTFADGRISGAVALYHIDWRNIQVGGFTQNGFLQIRVNGNDAVSQGFEVSGQALMSDAITVSSSYAFSDAHLSQDAPGLIRGTDAFKGDRLPGSPKHQLSAALDYETEIGDDFTLRARYGVSYTSALLTTAGARGSGERLSGYDLHQASVTLARDAWELSLFVDNLFDEYAVTGTRTPRSTLREVNGIPLRFYAEYIIRPRVVGLEARYKFGTVP